MKRKVKVNFICIDMRNDEQVNWWNDIASKLVKVVRYDTIVDAATNKLVGVVFTIKGHLADSVIKANTQFLGTNNNYDVVFTKRLVQ